MQKFTYLPSIVLFVCFQQYLGSMLVKELRGTESTQDACAKMRVKLNLTLCLVLKPQTNIRIILVY